MKFMAYIEHDPKSNMYVAQIPSIPGAYAQAKSLNFLHQKLTETAKICLVKMDEEDRKFIPEFVGILHMEIS